MKRCELLVAIYENVILTKPVSNGEYYYADKSESILTVDKLRDSTTYRLDVPKIILSNIGTSHEKLSKFFIKSTGYVHNHIAMDKYMREMITNHSHIANIKERIQAAYIMNPSNPLINMYGGLHLKSEDELFRLIINEDLLLMTDIIVDTEWSKLERIINHYRLDDEKIVCKTIQSPRRLIPKIEVSLE